MRSPHTATESSPRSPQLEKACEQQRRPNTAKNKMNKINLVKKKRIISLPGINWMFQSRTWTKQHTWSMRLHYARSSCIWHLSCVVCPWHTYWLPSHPSLPLSASLGCCEASWVKLCLVQVVIITFLGLKLLLRRWPYKSSWCRHLHLWLPLWKSAISCDWRINYQGRTELRVKSELWNARDRFHLLLGAQMNPFRG